MEPRYRLRLYLLTALVLTGFGVLLNRLHDFQIDRRDEFLQMVPGNSTVTVREPGIRGEITDRNGILLARNLRNYEIAFNLEEVYRAYHSQDAEDPSLKHLTRKDGPGRADEENDIVNIVNHWTIKRFDKLGLTKNYNAGALRTHYLTHRGLVPFSYRTDLTYDEFARCAEHNLVLPGVNLSTRPLRLYPYGALASHVLGYIKPWEPADIPESAKRKFNHYIGDAKGIAGIEQSMDAVLRGQEGQKKLLKDEKGHIIRMIDYTKPGVGAKLTLAIDARAQLHVENVIRRAGRAAAVVMDVNTGEVIAMASIPDYNPNDFIPSISEARWNAYLDNQKMDPFSNRTIRPFTPGSTFKPPTAIAGALEGMANRNFSCDGFILFGKIRIGCWIWNLHKGSHGTLTLPKAIQQSCNPYFMKLANTIGWKAMVTGFQMVGFGKPTGIELPDESAGILPGSGSWRAANPAASMTPAITAMLAIGQADAMATPLQLCAMAACLANGGKYYMPRIVKSATAADGRRVIEDKPKLVVNLIEAGIKPPDLELIRRGMWQAVNKPGGTAARVKIPNIEVAGKTGTAQTIDTGKKSNNSWVICFGPFDQPKYAVCVLVQNGGSGGKVCGPLAHLILRGLFAQDEGLKLPLKAQTAVLGNTARIEEIVIPKDDPLVTLNPDEAEGSGETGEEVENLEATPAPATPEPVIPTPVITPEIDEDGTVIPRAQPVPEP
ncbi:MAG: penicillin-binding transpeptidase domain-containing protein [Verrucomicrobia bacterium]|nr:penicillin-binding transpeptidase domain-containing protein [Verrucomicrobiota bacterium]